MSHKKLRCSFLICGLALLFLVTGFWPRSSKTESEPRHTKRSLRVDHAERDGNSDHSLLSTESSTNSSTLQPEPAEHRENLSVFDRFNDWCARYVAASKKDKRELLDEGMKIAQERRVELLRLIETDPRLAIQNAVPPVIRQQLPYQLVKLLEERVNEKGFYGLLGAVTTAEYPKTPPYRREVRTDDGGYYRAYVYGRRLGQPTTENDSIVGIAVDDAMAIDERPLRVVANGEIPNHPNNLTRSRSVVLRDEQGFSNGREQLTTPAEPRDVVETCPISGQITEVAATENTIAVTEAEVVVEASGQFHYLCRGGHIVEFEEKLISREGGNGGPSMPTSPPTATQSTGYKTHLLMRVAFPEALKGSISEKEGHELGKNVQDWFLNSSYGSLSFMTTVTPLIVLPRSEAWYKDQDISGSAYEVLSDARVAAKAAGYDPANFNFDTVIYTGTPGSFGGQAYVGGKGCWLKSGTGVGVACHEYGHNFGVMHANFWSTTNGSVIGGGSHVEYGDSFDTMGSANAGDYQFSACHKNILNWIPTPLVHDVTTSGTYRIYQMDQPSQNPRLRYAIKTRKDADRDYWVDLRQLFASNAWVQGGVFLHWSPWESSEEGAHLLDATPGSIDGKNDAPLVIGRTFSDTETGIHITPIAKNATTPPSVDVVVNLGLFPDNQAPALALSSDVTSAATNAAVNFTATASDADGDVLSYAWDFGDKSFSTSNSPTVSKSWATAGEYRVRCTVSDMKGKTTSSSVVITVGSPTTFRISGTITANGQPLANVRVGNSKTGTSYREAITDANGTYHLVGLIAGTYTVSTQLYGYTFTPTGSASVTVGPSKSDINFTAAEQPQVSIAVQDADCIEGSNTGVFRISRTGSTAASLTVLISTLQGSAAKGSDYTQLPAFSYVAPFDTLSIPAGQSYVDVVMTANDDANVESFESIILTLVPSTSYVVGNAAGTLWIGDSDTVNPLVRLQVADRDVDESGDAGQFVIERLGATTSALNVSVAISGTATNGTDYTTIPTTITIPAGSSSAPVNVTPIQDSNVESMETVILTISTNAAYTRPSASADYVGTVNLHDDDQPIVTVVATDNTASESGNDPGVFTITRTGSTAAALTVNYGVTGSALHGTDYMPLPGVLTIPAGSAVATVVVTPIDDAIGEPSQTAVLQLRGGIGYTVGAASNSTVTISDNGDSPYASIAVTTGPAVEGGTTGVFQVTTTGTGTGNISVLYTVTGTATSGTDFTSLSGTLSMGKNTTSSLSIATIQDILPEGYETVTVTLTPDPAYSLALDSSATMNLQDDDAPQVNVSTTDDSFTESNGSLAKFFVSRTGSTSGALTVNYTLGGTATSGVDYTSPTGSVTIAAGAAGAFVDISLLDDTLAEGTESIIFNVASGSGYVTGIGSATRYITDAESASVTTQVRFSAATSSAAENVGTINIPVTLSAAAAENVTVEYIINGGNALAAGIDYTLSAAELTFAPGETSKNIVVTLSDDALDEINETIVVLLVNPSNAKLGTSSHTLTITDNDTPLGATVGFAGTVGSGLESQSTAPLAVALSAAQASSVTVDFTVTGGTATGGGVDYTITSGTLTFAAGETVKVIPNTIIDDVPVDADETIILTLSNPTGAVLNANPVFTYTITDNDAATVTVAATDASAAEPGTDTGLFTVTRTGSTAAALTVNFSISGTATSGSDYANLPSSLVIPAGAGSATLLVTPLNDTVVDPAKTVILTLATGVYTIGTPNDATVSITDDEVNMFVTVAATDPNAVESGDPGAFTVTRVGSNLEELTVNLGVGGTATSGSDFTALPTSVVIPAAASSAVIPLSPLTDAVNEGDETVILSILASSSYSRGNPVSATVTIANTDDGSPPTLAASAIVDDKGGASIYIDTPVTYTVSFSKDMDATTVNPSDFGNAGNAELTISSVSETTPTSGVFTVQVTPTSGGSLQLKVNAGVDLKSALGTNLNTTSAIADNTIITVAGYAPTLADALDATGLTWTGGGNANWSYQTTTTHDGVDAGRSGALGFDQVSSMQTTVVGPGSLSFWWKVSSENNYDWLTFTVDGVAPTEAPRISGTVDWVQKTVPIASGSHIIKWSYSTDYSLAVGSDAGWVDQVVYSPTSAPEIAVEQPLGTNLVDGTASVNLGSVNLSSSSAPITFTVKNTGALDLTGLALSKDGTHSSDYTLSSLGASSLAPGASTTFTVTFTPGATGTRTAAIHLTSNDADENPFDISLTGTGVPLGTLAVTPAGGLTSTGGFGGPFSPSSQVYTLTNSGGTSINWTAAKTAAWVNLSATSGTLAAGATTTVTVSLDANALALGNYSDTVTFTNTTNNNGNTTRGVSLTVNQAAATVNLSNLSQTYNGSPKPITVTTTPASLANSVTYAGSATAPTDAGTYAVVATVTNPNYTGSASGTLTISKAAQTISFAALDPVLDNVTSFALTATASSGQTVSYTSSNTSVATVSGNTVTVVGLGSTTITATQAGNANYNAATAVPQTLTVVRSNPHAVITGAPYKLLLGQSLTLNGSASEASYGATISTYEWDLNNDSTFGDAIDANPTAIGFASLTSTWGMVEGLNTIKLKITDSSGKSSIVSATVQLVFTLTWDANGTTSGQTNGGAAWLSASRWWDGAANQTWAPGSNAIFGGPSTNGGNVTLASPTSVNAITFNTFTGTYNLGTAGQALTINGGINKTATSAGVTISSPVILGASQTWTNNSGGGFTMSSTLDNGGNVLTLDGSGTFTMKAAIISGSGGLTKNGSGFTEIGGQYSAVSHTYTGTTTINGGTLRINGDTGALGNLGSGNLTLNGGVLEHYYAGSIIRTLGPDVGQIQILGGASGFGYGNTGSVTLNNNAEYEVVWGSDYFNPSTFVLNASTSGGTTTFANKVDLNTATRTIQVNAGTAVMSGIIRTSSGTAGLTKTGVGQLRLSGANSFNGVTTISNGVLTITNGSALGSTVGNTTLAATGATNGPQLKLSGTITSPENINITGATEISGYTSVISNTTNSNALSGNITLNNTSGGIRIGSVAGTLTFSGNISQITSSNGLAFITNNGASIVVNNAISNNGGGLDIYNTTQTTGTGVVTLKGVSGSGIGATSVWQTGILKLGVTNALNTSADLTLGAVTTTAGHDIGTLDLAGFNQTVNALIGSKNTSNAAADTSRKVTNSATGTGTSTLTVGNGDGSGTFNGVIVDGATAKVALTKTGLGNQVLAGDNTYSGVTNISAGKLFINGSLSNIASALNVSGGATLGGTGTVGRNITIAAGGKLEFDISTDPSGHDPLNISAGRDFAFAAASELTITSTAGIVSGTYTLITGGNNITGVSPATVNMPAGWAATTSIVGGSLMLHVTGTVDHFAISSISTLQTVGKPITGITITAQDANNQTVASFTGTVFFGGSSGITGTTTNFVNGVLSGVSVTPNVAGNNLTLTVSDVALHTGMTTLSVQTMYEEWSDGSTLTGDDALPNADPDGDGLTNVQEFAFGLNPTANGSGGTLSYTPDGEVTTAGLPVLKDFDADPVSTDFRAVFVRQKDFASAGLTYTATFSADLSRWTASATGMEVLTNGTGDMEAVSIPFPDTVPLQGGGNAAPKFFRIGISAGN